MNLAAVTLSDEPEVELPDEDGGGGDDDEPEVPLFALTPRQLLVLVATSGAFLGMVVQGLLHR